jgi:hypothetical protein
MGSWRVAKCLDQLLDEINASAPNRSKVSDGSIGDEDHQSRNSDHNPWCCGWVVTARDYTHDPAGGFDSYAFADWLRQRCRGDILIDGKRETRLKYIISNRQIAEADNGWNWTHYSGDNPHDHHCHVSCDCTGEGGYMDDTTPFGWASTTGDDTNMLCKYGDTGDKVTSLQCLIEQAGGSLPQFGHDGSYGDEVANALVALGVAGDGTGQWYGPYEYGALMAKVAQHQMAVGKDKDK